MTFYNANISVHFVSIIFFSLFTLSIGCLDESDSSDRNNNNNNWTGEENSSVYHNSGTPGDNNQSANNTGINVCGGEGALFYDGQPASLGQACGACSDGELECTDNGDLECVNATPANICGGCGELVNIPGEECGLNLVWQCDGNQELVCAEPNEEPDVIFITPDFETIDSNENVDSTSVILKGGVSKIPPVGVINHGFCLGREPEPTIEQEELDIFADNYVFCESLGTLTDAGEFEVEFDELLPGRTYYARMFVQTASRAYYADEISFTTAAPPIDDLSAQLNPSGDTVELGWTPIVGALEYSILRDGVELTRIDGLLDTYVDDTIDAHTPPDAPLSVEASNIFVDRIKIEWDESSTVEGKEYIYAIKVHYPDADSEPSEESTTLLPSLEVLSYEIFYNGDWQNIGLTLEFEDFDAPLNQISDFDITASQGSFVEYVRLSLDALPDVEVIESSYQIRAVNAAGAGTPSDEVTGHLAFEALQVQWQRSPNSAENTFIDLDSASELTYIDTTAPADGSPLFYRSVISASGVQTRISDSQIGYRAVLPEFDATPPAVMVDGTTVNVETTVANTGNTTTEYGLCYGTSPNPTHESQATCIVVDGTNGDGTLTGIIENLPAGNTYYISPYATTPHGTIYGESAVVTIAPEIFSLSAVGQLTSINLIWSEVPNASGYEILRDGTPIAQLAAGQNSYNDSSATSAPAPAAPMITSITEGDDIDGITISWDSVTPQPGPTHSYEVRALSDSGQLISQGEAQGQTQPRTISSYEIKYGTNDWTTVDTSSGLTYFDADAPYATIQFDDIDATQGDHIDRVELTVTLDAITPPATRSYEVRAISAAGAGQAASAIGSRGYNTNYNYQWYHSDTNDKTTFAELIGQTNATGSDTTEAPNNGTEHYYYVQVTADGAQAADSDIVRGYRENPRACLQDHDRYDPTTAQWSDVLGVWGVELPCLPNDEPGVYEELAAYFEFANDYVRFSYTTSYYDNDQCNGTPIYTHIRPNAPQEFLPLDPYNIGIWVDLDNGIREFDFRLLEEDKYTELQLTDSGHLVLLDPRDAPCGDDANDRCTFEAALTPAIPLDFKGCTIPTDYGSPLVTQTLPDYEGYWVTEYQRCEPDGGGSKNALVYSHVTESDIENRIYDMFYDDARCAGNLLDVQLSYAYNAPYFIGKQLPPELDGHAIYEANAVHPILYQGLASIDTGQLSWDITSMYNGAIKVVSANEIHNAMFDMATYGDPFTMCGLHPDTRCSDFSHHQVLTRVSGWPDEAFDYICMDMSTDYDVDEAVWPELLGIWSTTLPMDDDNVVKEIYLDFATDFMRYVEVHHQYDIDGTTLLYSLNLPNAPHSYLPEKKYRVGTWVTADIRHMGIHLFGEDLYYAHSRITGGGDIYEFAYNDGTSGCGDSSMNHCNFDSPGAQPISFERQTNIPDNYAAPYCHQKLPTIVGLWRVEFECVTTGTTSERQYAYVDITTDYGEVYLYDFYYDDSNCEGNTTLVELNDPDPVLWTQLLAGELVQQAPDTYEFEFVHSQINNVLDLHESSLFNTTLKIVSYMEMQVAAFDPMTMGDPAAMCGLSPLTRCTDFTHKYVYERVFEWPIP